MKAKETTSYYASGEIIANCSGQGQIKAIPAAEPLLTRNLSRH